MRPTAEAPDVERLIIKLINRGEFVTSAKLKAITDCTQQMANRLLCRWNRAGILDRHIRIPDKKGGYWHEYTAGPHFDEAKVTELYQTRCSDVELAIRKQEKMTVSKADFLSVHSNLMRKIGRVNVKLALMWLDEACKLKGSAGALVVASAISADSVLYPLWSTATGFNENCFELLRDAPGKKWGLFLVRGDIHAAIRI